MVRTMSHPIVHARTLKAISSPIKHHGAYGSKGTSCKNSACAKKKPAAMNGICVGQVASWGVFPPIEMRKI